MKRVMRARPEFRRWRGSAIREGRPRPIHPGLVMILEYTVNELHPMQKTVDLQWRLVTQEWVVFSRSAGHQPGSPAAETGLVPGAPSALLNAIASLW